MLSNKITFFVLLIFTLSFSSCDILRDVLNQGMQQNMSCVPATSSEYQLSYHRISAKTFRKDKLDAAFRETNNACFTTNQIKGIATLMTFEHDRLDYAKYAYARCSDQKNYSLMLDIFTFESSKRELEAIM